MTEAESGPDQVEVEVLLRKIAAETRRRELDRLLRELKDVPSIPDCTVLLPLTRHRWWQVRWGAMQALGNCPGDDRAEQALLAVLADPMDDEYDQWNANIALAKIGTAAAIPALAAQVHYPKEDVKATAIVALSKIGGASLVPIYLDALSDRSWITKAYAMTAIAEHGDETAIGPVCDRVRVILSRHRKQDVGDLVDALRFLSRYRSDERVQATLAWITGKRSAYLFEGEAQWMREHGLISE